MPCDAKTNKKSPVPSSYNILSPASSDVSKTKLPVPSSKRKLSGCGPSSPINFPLDASYLRSLPFTCS